MRCFLLTLVLALLAAPVAAQDSAQFYKGTFTASGSTGDQTISGIVDDDGNAFTPKAILIWGSQQASATTTDGFFWNLGFTDCTNQRTLWGGVEDNVATSNTSRSIHNARLIDTYDASRSNLSRATIVSCGSGQFTINWSVADAATPVFHFVAWGGSGVSAAVNTLQANVSSPSSDNAAFVAQAMFVAATSLTSNGTSTPQIVTGMGLFALQSDFAFQQAVAWSCSEHGQGSTDASRFQVTTQTFSQPNGNCSGNSLAYAYAGANYGLLSVTPNDEWGWTLALGGVRAKAGAGTQPTSTGTQQITSIGFAPKLVLLFSVGNTSSATVATEGRWSFGAATPDAQGHVWVGDQDEADPTVTARKHSTSDVISMCDTVNATGSSTTCEAVAAVSAWGSDDFTLNWTAADATQREYIWIAFGVPEPLSEGGSGYSRSRVVN